MGGSGWGTVFFFAAICSPCRTRYSRKVAVQVMMEQANCFGA